MLLRLMQGMVRRLKADPTYSFDPALTASDVVAIYWKLFLGVARAMYHRPFLRRSTGLASIGRRVTLRNRRLISHGRSFVAEDGCEIQGLSRAGVSFGDNVTVGAYAMIRPSGYYGREIGEGLVVGDRSNVGPFCYLGASGGIEIGRDVMMGPGVALFAENHVFDRTDIPMRQQGVRRQRIVVEDDCWLASGSVVLAGVRIGRGSIIAAGSVVTKDVPPFSIVAGAPARVVRSRVSGAAGQSDMP